MKRGTQNDDSPRPTVARKVSVDEEETSDVFVDSNAPERRYICDGVIEEDFEHINAALHKLHPWLEDIDEDTRYYLRIHLFRYLVTRCAWLNQKYNLKSWDSFNVAAGLFEANPWLVSDIDECWSNPEGSFLKLCHLGEYWDNLRRI